jgi:GTP-binding protein HflX
MPPTNERTKLEVKSERAIVAAVRLPDARFDVQDPFGELKALAEQAGATVVGELTQNLAKPVAATFMGSGKVGELKALCETLEASTIIFDHDLSPKQIGNIEKETGRKVVDRSELILDIFASRAQTTEAQLQVELAQLEYTFPRLRAMWDHLERLVGRGGIGGIGTRGPGEQQLEIDRRLVQNRRVDLQRRLAEVQARKRREVSARKAEHFTVGIVGYTNAGKSTLFNTLTAGGAYADDRLFATLLTRTREWDLGGGLNVMLSDTVGFVRDLPHNLIASFKATLEEATHADLLLIALDVSDPAAEMHFNTVNTTLDELFADLRESAHAEDKAVREPPRILLLNKVDRLKDNAQTLVWAQRLQPSAAGTARSALPDQPAAPDSPSAFTGGPPIAVCALRSGPNAGQGLDELRARVRGFVEGPHEELLITIPLADSRSVDFVEKRGAVLERTYTEDSVTLRVRIGIRIIERARSTGSRLIVHTTEGVEIPPPKKAPPAERQPWVATPAGE